jgi:hypothetical protein
MGSCAAMTRIAFALSTMPLALAGFSVLLVPTAPPVTKSDRQPPALASSVQTIQFVRPEGPTAAPGLPVASQEAPPLPEPRPYQASPPAPRPAAEPARKIRRSVGLCARHALRKVWISSTRWRCRR